jgi:hypothetical protein
MIRCRGFSFIPIRNQRDETLAKPRGFAGSQNPEVRIQKGFKIKTKATATHSDYWLSAKTAKLCKLLEASFTRPVVLHASFSLNF